MKKAFTGPKQREAFLGKSRQLMIAVAALLLSFSSEAQTRSNMQQINTPYSYPAMEFRKLAYIPLDTFATVDSGAIAYKSGRFWLKRATKWVDWGLVPINDSAWTFGGDTLTIQGGGGGSTDTTSLSDRINLKISVSDSASMLLPYLRKADTASLSTRINLKLNLSDTAAMLGGYTRVQRFLDSCAALRAAIASGGAGEANTISSVGTGTSVVKGKTGVDLQVKSIQNSTHIKWAALTNDVSANIDSSYLANTHGLDSLSLDTLGVIYNKTSWALLGEFFTAIGGVSASVVSNKINIASSGNNDYNRYLLTEYKSKIEHWRLQADIIINNTPSATTYGIGLGKILNPIGWVDLTNGANAGKIYLNSSSTNLAVSGLAISFSNLDTIALELRQSVDTVYFTVRNKTTGAAGVTISYAYSLTYGQAIEPPVASPFAIFEKGGAYIVNNMTLTSAEPINVPVLFIGTSKWLGQYAGSFAARASQLMNDRYTRTTNYGLSGGKLTDFIDYLPEIRSLRAKQIVLGDAGSNDKRGGVLGGVWRANYRRFVDSLKDMGAKVYHAPIWENSLDLSDIVTFLDSTYPRQRFLTFEAMQACGTACLVADNVHPNARGNDTLATVIIRDGRLLRNNYRLNIRYVEGRWMGNNQSASASLVVNNNGQFLKSTAAVMGLYQQGGNAFGTTATLGTTDNNNVNLLRNGLPLIRYNDYPNHLLFHDKSGDEVVRIRADSVNNIAFGKGSHASMTTGGAGNTSGGSEAGMSSTTAANNTDYGYQAGRNRTIGQRNTNIGMSANYYGSGSQNVVVGSFAASGNVSASFAGVVAVGDGALYGMSTAIDAIGLGRAAGANLTSGGNCTIIGTAIDFPSATASNQLNIKNGIFGTGMSGTGTTIAGKIGIMNNAPSVTFHITGTDAIGIPVGTTAQRPTGASGYLRLNSDSSELERYDGSAWRGFATKKFVTDLGYISNPMTTAGDLIGATTSGVPVRIAKGTANQVLGMNSGATAQEYKTLTEGTGISIVHSAGAVTITATGLPTNGSWTPTPTSVTNVTGSTINQGRYTKNGEVITCSITIAVDPTAAGLTELDLSPVFASTFSGASVVSGTATSSVGVCGMVSADSANSRLKFVFTALTGDEITFALTIQYTQTLP